MSKNNKEKQAQKAKTEKPKADASKEKETKVTKPSSDKSKESKSKPATEPKKVVKPTEEKVVEVKAEEVPATKVIEEPAPTALANTPGAVRSGQIAALADILHPETTIGTVADIMGVGLGKKDDSFKNRDYVDLLGITNDIIKRGNPESQYIIDLNEGFLMMHGWTFAKAWTQMYLEGKASEAKMPHSMIRVFSTLLSNFGINFTENALQKAEQSADPQLPFDNGSVTIDDQTIQQVKKEAAIIKEPVPELDHTKWKSDEDISKALWYTFSNPTGDLKQKFSKVIEMVQQFRCHQASSAEESTKVLKIPVGELWIDAVTLLGKLPPMMVTGICSTLSNYLNLFKDPTMAHMTMKNFLPDTYTDEDVKSMLYAFVTLIAKDKQTELKDLSIYSYLTTGGNKELYAQIVLDPDGNDSIKIGNNKRLLKAVRAAYGDDLQGKSGREFDLNLTNKLIDITNLYRADNTLIESYVEKGYPERPEPPVEETPDTTAAPVETTTETTPTASVQEAPKEEKTETTEKSDAPASTEEKK